MSNKDKYGFTQYHGDKNRIDASRMAQRLNDPDGFRTATRETPEETVVYQTKGGMPQYRVERKEREEDTDNGIHRGFVAKVFWIVSSSASALAARLLQYAQKWTTRTTSFTYGVATGYTVVHNQQTPIPPAADKTYHDVVYWAGQDFMRYTSVSAGGVRSKLMEAVTGSVYGIPVVLNPIGAKSFPSAATLDADDYHVFCANETTVNHIAGRTKVIDLTVTKDDYIYDRLPMIYEMVSYSMGYDPVEQRVTMFGDAMTYYGSMIQNIYHWYMVLQLSRTSPYISVQNVIANPCPPRGYRYFIDLALGGTTSNTSTGNPGFDPGGAPATWPCISVYPYSMTPIRPESEGSLYYKWSGREGYAGKVSGNLVKIGSEDAATFDVDKNVYNESFPVGTQVGVKQLTHAASVAVNYDYRYGVCTYNYNLIMPYYPGADWSIGGAEVPPGGTVTGNAGGVTSYRVTNTSTTSVAYVLQLDTPITLYSLEGRFDYDWLQYDQAIGVSLDSSDEDSTIGHIHDGYRGMLDNPPEMTRIRGVGILSTTNQHVDLQNGVSEITVVCRDYIFHDIVEDVSVYLEGHIYGKKYGAKIMSGGGGTLSLKLVVNIRGSIKEVEIIPTTVTPGHNAGFLEYDYLFNGFLQPACVYPHENPAVYHPVCEQGMFPYIAYTTKAEEALGIPRRFLLSVPLAINQHDMSLLGDANNPPPYAYAFTAHNLTWASSQTQMGFFSFLYGKAFIVHVSHDGSRDWITDLKIADDKDKDHHFAEVYRV